MIFQPLTFGSQNETAIPIRTRINIKREVINRINNYVRLQI